MASPADPTPSEQALKGSFPSALSGVADLPGERDIIVTSFGSPAVANSTPESCASRRPDMRGVGHLGVADNAHLRRASREADEMEVLLRDAAALVQPQGTLIKDLGDGARRVPSQIMQRKASSIQQIPSPSAGPQGRRASRRVSNAYSNTLCSPSAAGTQQRRLSRVTSTQSVGVGRTATNASQQVWPTDEHEMLRRVSLQTRTLAAEAQRVEMEVRRDSEQGGIINRGQLHFGLGALVEQVPRVRGLRDCMLATRYTNFRGVLSDQSEELDALREHDAKYRALLEKMDDIQALRMKMLNECFERVEEDLSIDAPWFDTAAIAVHTARFSAAAAAVALAAGLRRQLRDAAEDPVIAYTAVLPQSGGATSPSQPEGAVLPTSPGMELPPRLQHNLRPASTPSRVVSPVAFADLESPDAVVSGSRLAEAADCAAAAAESALPSAIRKQPPSGGGHGAERLPAGHAMEVAHLGSKASVEAARAALHRAQVELQWYGLPLRDAKPHPAVEALPKRLQPRPPPRRAPTASPAPPSRKQRATRAPPVSSQWANLLGFNQKVYELDY
eukprot:TRINITY_DN72_c3_g1_i2.p1 TRINITY_DN72_c3_g1~~TRINITY_DN72_c3_g1_i2.p1  ORF type:complete len:586 (+),score=184.16 TRINITY_DN72_c3_g1_i2:81-1760(+)